MLVVVVAVAEARDGGTLGHIEPERTGAKNGRQTTRQGLESQESRQGPKRYNDPASWGSIRLINLALGQEGGDGGGDGVGLYLSGIVGGGERAIRLDRGGSSRALGK